MWGETVLTSVYTINGLSTEAIHDKIPTKMWYGYRVALETCVFSAVLHPHTYRKKIVLENFQNEVSKQLIMNACKSNGYRLWNLSEHKIVTARSVKFDESPKPLVQVPDSVTDKALDSLCSMDCRSTL
ncbi:hypothetical protein JTB14_016822 [Gonioctena quinquepunctata]|nr:hypothetical protein JTB14_016822 [Gonioctena quinquepunctata]